jgi:hypothetical protein
VSAAPAAGGVRRTHRVLVFTTPACAAERLLPSESPDYLILDASDLLAVIKQAAVKAA